MPNTWHLGLIGHPLGHSLSPVLHQAALAEAGLVGDYALFPIPPLPEGQPALLETLQRMRQGELQGLNVTIPHKQSVLPLVDELTPSAKAIGAVNTLIHHSGRLIGHNTDAPGFLADVSQLPLRKSKTALLLGAGGAARAVVYALLSQGWKIFMTDLNPDQASSLYQHFATQEVESANLTVIADTPQEIHQASSQVILIVNATPAGMHPLVNETPWPEGVALPSGACLYDLVYNPAETRLLQSAKAAGLPCRNGLGMLMEQAALSFESWTGFNPSRSRMWDEVVKTNPSLAGGTR